MWSEIAMRFFAPASFEYSMSDESAGKKAGAVGPTDGATVSVGGSGVPENEDRNENDLPIRCR